MAEARSLHVVGGELRRGVNLSLTEEGLKVDLSFVVPPPRKAYRLLQRRWAHLTRKFTYALWPWGLPVFLGVMVVVVGAVVFADRSSWLRSGWLATMVWEFSSYFPWLDVPLSVRVGILAAWAALIGAVLLTYAQRLLFRLLYSYQQILYESRNPSFVTKVWFAVISFANRFNPTPLTYSYQSSLPALPLPSLQNTVRKYVASAKLLVKKPEDAKAIEDRATKFLAEEGPTLQWYLQLAWWFSDNYVTEWWEKYVYLRGRSPIVINSNYYILDQAWQQPTKQRSARAALVSHSILRFMLRLEEEKLEPILLPTKVPLCMEQYKRIFGTTRIPGREMDEIVHFEDSRHIVVLCKGQFFKLPVFKSNGIVLSPQELELQYEAIAAAADESEGDPHEASIPALTGWNRTRWAEARENFFSSGVNRSSLYTIESALFFVSLDEEEHDLLDWTARGRSLIHGSSSNRWFDKSFTLVFFKNGKMGLNAEHSWADAPILAHLLEESLLVAEKLWSPYDPKTGFIRPDFRPILPHEPALSAALGDPCDARARLRNFRKLEWHLSRRAEAAIAEAKASVLALIDNLDLNVVAHTRYGKRFMKACGVSPDAYVQMAMQLAWYRDQKCFSATYEAAMTRLFYRGRTETIRPCTEQAVAFVRAMEDPKTSPEEKLKLLQKAEKQHKITTADAMTGHGLDRHLFALYVVSVGKGVDSPFLAEALGTPWRLSTSQQPQQQTNYWNLKDEEDQKRQSPGGGFGPVAEDGYGVSYMISGEDSIFFHVSANRSHAQTDSARFIHQIFKALRDMQEVLKTALPAEKREKALKTKQIGPSPPLPRPPAGFVGVDDEEEEK